MTKISDDVVHRAHSALGCGLSVDEIRVRFAELLAGFEARKRLKASLRPLDTEKWARIAKSALEISDAISPFSPDVKRLRPPIDSLEAMFPEYSVHQAVTFGLDFFSDTSDALWVLHLIATHA